MGPLLEMTPGLRLRPSMMSQQQNDSSLENQQQNQNQMLINGSQEDNR